MANDMGTPKTLEEAIRNALCIGPLAGVEQRVYQHVRDFLSQKFGTAYLENHSEQEVVGILSSLFDKIVKKEGK